MTTGPRVGAHLDEIALWDALQQGEWPRHAGRRLGVHRRRVEYLCLKWSRRGCYDYGTACDIGWPLPHSDRWLQLRKAWWSNAG